MLNMADNHRCRLMYGTQARFFEDEISPKRKHEKRGAVGMASAGPGLNASQFYITLGDALDSLDEKHTLFGQVGLQQQQQCQRLRQQCRQWCSSSSSGSSSTAVSDVAGASRGHLQRQ
jgi:cyclophilin family peptidyl-prolyl cis-trans isomerase